MLGIARGMEELNIPCKAGAVLRERQVGMQWQDQASNHARLSFART